MTTRVRLVLALLAASALVAGGCNVLGYVGHKIAKPFVPPETYEKQFDLTGKSVLVLVDVADPELGADFPRVPGRLTKTVTKLLDDEGACGPTVPYHDVVAARRTERGFDEWPSVRAGEYFNVDYVVHVVLYEFRVRENPASSYLEGYGEATVRVISTESGKQEWPLLAAAKIVTARTVPDIKERTDPAAVEEIVARGLSTKIARKFYTYTQDDVPLRPDFK